MHNKKEVESSVLQGLNHLAEKIKELIECNLIINERIEIMSSELDALSAQVQVNSDLLAKIAAFIQGLSPEDKAKLVELTNQIKDADDALAALIP